jgi:hypothetical protein
MFRLELASTDETATRVEEISMRSDRRARSPVRAPRLVRAIARRALRS